MIVDQLKNSILYREINKKITGAFHYLHTTDIDALSPGRHEIDDDMYAVVLQYETKPAEECPLERHRKHIDVQYIHSGEEIIGVAPFRGQAETKAYDDENDYAFFQEKTSPMLLHSGMFAIFFPEDLHAPCAVIDRPVAVKKVVVKVRI